MDAQFWIDAWNEGRTNFHQLDFNEKLLKFFPLLGPVAGQKVLVPLCGKTKDLIWLAKHGLDVKGVELYEEPVKAFFEENHLTPPEIHKDENFIQYSYKNISISCGDFLKLKAGESYELIYDRAALVALPKDMRKDYAALLKKVLNAGGKYLLVVYEYDQAQMEGPPFSVDEAEVQELYGDAFKIELLESELLNLESGKFSALKDLKLKTYLLSSPS